MLELMSLRSELMLICSTLTKALLVEIITAVEKVSKNPETREKISLLVTSLCVEAVDKIFEVLEEAAASSALKNPSKPGGATADFSPAEQTVILVYNKGSAVVSEPFLLSPGGRAAGGSNARPLADYPDHDYARCSRPLGASAAGGPSLSAPTHLPCSQCGRLFPNAERLADHRRKSHPACSVCGAAFTGVLKLREHEMKAHGLLPYACDYCPKTFNHKAHRDLHAKVRHTGEKPCRCDVCGKGYASAGMLKTHRVTHGDKTFTCDVCGKSFFHFCHLTRHKLAHRDVRPHRCDACGRGFAQAENLRSHQAAHGGERQLCPVCGRTYRCLRNHVVRRHARGLSPHELAAVGGGGGGAAVVVVACPDCGKTFPNRSQLRAHRRCHAAPPPSRCDLCGMGSRGTDLLGDHRYTHADRKPHLCELCAAASPTARLRRATPERPRLSNCSN